MSENQVMRLCGGTFFALITRAMNKRKKPAKDDHHGKPLPPLTELGCLQALICVYYPDCPDPTSSFKNDITAYKECRRSANINLPFDNTEALKKFHKEIVSDYLTPLRRMRDFCNFYIEDVQADRLIRALLELLDADPSIGDSDRFYASLSGQPVTFLDLRCTKGFYLPAFLLGIWDYILLNRQDNTIGQDTYRQWFHPGQKNRSDEWSSDIGTDLLFADVVYEKPSDQTLARLGLTNAPEDRQQAMDNELSGEYSVYLSKAKRAFRQVKTLLYTSPKDFYSFYVPNRVKVQPGVLQNGSARPISISVDKQLITDVTPATLSAVTNYIILTGPGGIGKSMMMRHLLLNAIVNYPQTKMVPVFISLKDFNGEISSLFDFIYAIVHEFQPTVTEADFNNDLSYGHFVLLFDGLDEIRSSRREDFENKLEHFTNIYPHNIFIISTRPYSNFIHMSKFTVAQVLPFDKTQALQLIDRLDYRSDEPAFKANFKKAIDNELYETHEAFVRNPLLLTIMLLTYDLYADIPSKRYLFYRKAYDALAQQHDAAKPNGFHRIWETGWTPERFAEVFSEFCAYTYVHEQYDFTPEEMDRCFNKLEELKRYPKDSAVTSGAFTDDLVNSLCIMYREYGNYHFTHRSFQEYFCALFFSNQKDEDLQAIGDYFERRNANTDSDAAFAMLYDMIPLKVEEYILLPYLSGVFSKHSREENYIEYLTTCYPVITYFTDLPFSDTLKPASYLMRFICSHLDIPYSHEDIWLTPMPEFKEDDIYSMLSFDDEGGATTDYFSESDLTHMELDVKDTEYEGSFYRVPIAELFSSANLYGKLIDELAEKNFVLRIEFNIIYSYYLGLKEKYSHTHGADPFHFFSR